MHLSTLLSKYVSLCFVYCGKVICQFLATICQTDSDVNRCVTEKARGCLRNLFKDANESRFDPLRLPAFTVPKTRLNIQFDQKYAYYHIHGLSQHNLSNF